MKLCSKCIERLNIEAEAGECILCSNLLWKVDETAERIAEKLGDYEFSTFLVGSRLEGSIKALENYIFEEYNLGEEKSIKYEFNRELGKTLARLMEKNLSTNPDITIVYNLEKNDFEVQVKPVYVYGRYKKRVRNIPQTRWLCKECNGLGCEKCNFIGKRYVTSIEELIAEPCIEIAQGDKAILHGSGREDVDARMLGNGRPFVMEIQNPKRRSFDLNELEETVNREAGGKIAVSGLKFVEASYVEKIKTSVFRKTYRIKIEFENEVDRDSLIKALEHISNTLILQRTPKRVEHRRADIIRKKRTYDVRLILHRKKIAVVEIDADSGLYIKELISGDEGRTTPSLSEALNNHARVSKLDVIKIWD